MPLDGTGLKDKLRSRMLPDLFPIQRANPVSANEVPREASDFGALEIGLHLESRMTTTCDSLAHHTPLLPRRGVSNDPTAAHCGSGSSLGFLHAGWQAGRLSFKGSEFPDTSGGVLGMKIWEFSLPKGLKTGAGETPGTRQGLHSSWQRYWKRYVHRLAVRSSGHRDEICRANAAITRLRG